MPRYTDIDKLIAEYDRVHIGPPGGARKLMEDAPIADVVEVVRCKDCKHNTDNGGDCDRTLIHTRRNLVTETNEYLYFKLNCCEYGERKEGEADA